MPVPEAIFKPVVPGEAVVTLVLIENSQAMVHSWSDLRDHHLPTLLGTMKSANPIVPIQVLWLITSPVDDEFESPPSHYKELPDVRFDMSANNKISPAIINRGITLLASTFKGQLATRHLLLVAASSPSEAHASSSGSGVSEWQCIAQKLQEERIFLHVVLNPAQNMGPLSGLYYDALIRQNHQEVVPWFTANPAKYQFRLAGTPPTSASHFEDINNATTPTADLQINNLSYHAPLLRNYTYPPDHVGSSQESSCSTSEFQPDVIVPSLVTRLQKMHGLSKKKIYGSQGTRQPFIHDEQVCDKDRQIPTPLSIPLSPSSIMKSPSANFRVPSKTQADKAKCLSGRSPLTTGPPEAGGSSGRRSPWYRRNSRGALHTDSGSGSYPSSPTSVSSFTPNLPALPTPRDFDSHAAGAVNSVSALYEPSRIRDQTEQYSSATTLSTDTTLIPAYEQGSISPSYLGYPLQQLSPTPSSLTTNNFTSTSVMLRTNEHTEAPAVSSHIADGAEPFIICPEYEAAAAARFNAIFQTSPRSPNFPDLTSMNQYPDAGLINARNPYYSPSTESPAVTFSPPVMNFSYGQDFRHIPSQQFTQTMPHSFSPMSQNSSEFHSSGRSSSLQGWNGQYTM